MYTTQKHTYISTHRSSHTPCTCTRIFRDINHLTACTAHTHTHTERNLTEGASKLTENIKPCLMRCGHGLYPIEKSLEEVQRSQLEFIIIHTHRRTDTHTHTHTKRWEGDMQEESQSLILEQVRSQKSVYSLIQAVNVKHCSLTFQD